MRYMKACELGVSRHVVRCGSELGAREARSQTKVDGGWMCDRDIVHSQDTSIKSDVISYGIERRKTYQLTRE